jgi:hypothetical protein
MLRPCLRCERVSKIWLKFVLLSLFFLFRCLLHLIESRLIPEWTSF